MFWSLTIKNPIGVAAVLVLNLITSESVPSDELHLVLIVSPLLVEMVRFWRHFNPT